MRNITFLTLSFGIFLILFSCNNSGNEPNQDTNTHNTSQSSSSANTESIKVDARSKIPASRLNDGNLDTRASNRSNFPQGLSGGGSVELQVADQEEEQANNQDTQNNQVDEMQGQNPVQED
jgi:hypothetical protein